VASTIPRRLWTSVTVMLLAGVAGAEEGSPSYSNAEVEPYGRRVSKGGEERTSIAVVQGAYGARWGSFAPYVGAGLGFFTVRLRGGLAVLPGDLKEAGLIGRFEVQPQVTQIHCLEVGVLGQAAVGYRWPLEYRRPDEDAGPGLYVLPALESGPVWARARCTSGERSPGPPRPVLLIGGSVTMGLDW